MYRVSLTAFVLGAAITVATAPSPTTAETAHLTAATSTSADAVTAGRRVSLFLDVTPRPRMHFYAPGQEGFRTVALTLDPNPAIAPGKAKYPAGERIVIKGADEQQVIYARPFRIVQEVTVRSDARHQKADAADGTTLTITGTLRYQACDDTICYLPASVPVQWTVKVESRK
jgi:DsbC/DsbD-like thiol-disulfide interchange protein